MATIDNKRIIDQIIEANGHFGDDPRVYQIVEYRNAYGFITWGVTWVNETEQSRRRYEVETDWVHEPKIIWRNGFSCRG